MACTCFSRPTDLLAMNILELRARRQSLYERRRRARTPDALRAIEEELGAIRARLVERRWEDTHAMYRQLKAHPHDREIIARVIELEERDYRARVLDEQAARAQGAAPHDVRRTHVGHRALARLDALPPAEPAPPLPPTPPRPPRPRRAGPPPSVQDRAMRRRQRLLTWARRGKGLVVDGHVCYHSSMIPYAGSRARILSDVALDLGGGWWGFPLR